MPITKPVAGQAKAKRVSVNVRSMAVSIFTEGPEETDHFPLGELDEEKRNVVLEAMGYLMAHVNYEKGNPEKITTELATELEAKSTIVKEAV